MQLEVVVRTGVAKGMVGHCRQVCVPAAIGSEAGKGAGVTGGLMGRVSCGRV